MLTTPNRPMAIPPMRFNQSMVVSVTLSRSMVAPTVKTIHHDMEPQNMPPTRSDVCHNGRCLPRPSMASTARNESTVVGLVAVSRNADTKSECEEELLFRFLIDRGGLK